MIGLLLAGIAGYGVFLVYTSVVMGWRGMRVSPAAPRRRRRSLSDWLAQAGVDDVRPSEFAAVETAVFAIGALASWVLFGGVVASVLAGLFAAASPLAVYRSRRARLIDEAREAWPRMIEEIRLLTGSMGRSIPLAFLEVGRNAPTAPMRTAFEAAQREWLLSTDFGRTVAVLKSRLADPTADVACETLLVAHEVGGGDLDRRLAALADDRTMDLQDRKDARSRQAGVRFARWFVLAVPVGMALAGLAIGDGRRAYQSTGGQVGVALGIALTAACWLWASRIMRLPQAERVFAHSDSDTHRMPAGSRR